MRISIVKNYAGTVYYVIRMCGVSLEQLGVPKNQPVQVYPQIWHLHYLPQKSQVMLIIFFYHQSFWDTQYVYQLHQRRGTTLPLLIRVISSLKAYIVGFLVSSG